LWLAAPRRRQRTLHDGEREKTAGVGLPVGEGDGEIDFVLGIRDRSAGLRTWNVGGPLVCGSIWGKLGRWISFVVS